MYNKQLVELHIPNRDVVSKAFPSWLGISIHSMQRQLSILRLKPAKSNEEVAEGRRP